MRTSDKSNLVVILFFLYYIDNTKYIKINNLYFRSTNELDPNVFLVEIETNKSRTATLKC